MALLLPGHHQGSSSAPSMSLPEPLANSAAKRDGYEEKSYLGDSGSPSLQREPELGLFSGMQPGAFPLTVVLALCLATEHAAEEPRALTRC